MTQLVHCTALPCQLAQCKGLETLHTTPNHAGFCPRSRGHSPPLPPNEKALPLFLPLGSLGMGMPLTEVPLPPLLGGMLGLQHLLLLVLSLLGLLDPMLGPLDLLEVWVVLGVPHL